MSFITAMNEFAKACRILNEIEKAAFSTASTNINTLMKTLVESLANFRTADKASAIRSLRGPLSGLLGPAAVRLVLAPYARSVVEEVGLVDRGFAPNMVQIRDYMVGSADSVLSRGFVEGVYTQAAGGGTLVRLTKDRHKTILESAPKETVKFILSKDRMSGAEEHQEEFRFLGATPGEDDIVEAGTGEAPSALRLVNDISPLNLLSNPSFTDFNDANPMVGTPTAPSAVDSWPGWVIDNVANFRSSADNTSRDRTGQTDQKSLLVVGNGTIYQSLNGDTAPLRIEFIEDRPYIWGLRVFKPNGGIPPTGNLNIKLGSVTKTVALASIASNVKTLIHLQATQNSDGYYQNFKLSTPMRFEISVNTLVLNGNAGLFIDDIELVQMPLVRGSPYHIFGHHTNPLNLDAEYSIATPAYNTTRGIVQYWATFRTRIWELLGHPFSLPHSGFPTIVDLQ